MCGLVGFYPKKNKSVDLDKIYFLTIAIEERGIDSCGLAIGTNIYKGINDLSKSKNFIAKELINTSFDTLNKPVIFHNRSATIKSNLKDEYNVHPFKWETQDKPNDYFIGAHNGTLIDYRELKTKFCEGLENDLFQIDSHYILLSLYLNDKKEVLKEYKGAAALLFYDNNYFYVWKGGAGDDEERPLHYIENEDGWYFCSLPNPLKIAFKTEPTEIPNNCLFTFKDHKLIDKTIIERVKPVVQTIYSLGVWKGDTWTNVQETYYSDFIKISPKKRRYINKSGNLVDGIFYADKDGEITSYQKFSKTSKTVLFREGFLVKSMYLYNNLKDESIKLKIYNPESIAETLLQLVKKVIVDFVELKVNGWDIFYYLDLDGEVQFVYDRKTKLVDDFTTSINLLDCKVTCMPKLKIESYETWKNKI